MSYYFKNRFWGAARNEEEIVNLFLDGHIKFDK